jgi:hypothetical protein
MLTRIIVVPTLLFLVALAAGAVVLFWNKDKSADKDADKE